MVRNSLVQLLSIVIAVGFYMLWALLQAYIALSGNSQLYEGFFNASHLPLYPWAWRTLGEPLFPWLALLIVVFEYVGIMMLSHRPWSRWGQLGGMICNLLLVPFPWGWTNLLLAGLHAWLYTQNFEHSVLEPLNLYFQAKRVQ